MTRAIQKLDLLTMFNERRTDAEWNKAVEKTVNQLVDAVNKLETMAKNTNTILKSLVEENNVHESQIDKLQMKVFPEKLASVRTISEIEDAKAKRGVTFIDPYDEYRRWIGYLCKFRDKEYKDNQWDYGLLQAVEKAETAHIWKTGCFKHNLGHWYDFCEPVKPDDDIFYKG